MKNLILCSLAAAITAQFWGTISWMVLGWHNADFKQFSNDSQVAEVFKNELQGSGLYTIPNLDPQMHQDKEAMAEWDRKAQAGPFAFISVRAEGITPGMGTPMAIGFFLNLFIAAVLHWALINCKIEGLWGRSFFLAVVGSLGSAYPHISNWSWWNFPVTYCFVGVIDLFITWFLAGLVITKLHAKFAGKTV